MNLYDDFVWAFHSLLFAFLAFLFVSAATCDVRRAPCTIISSISFAICSALRMKKKKKKLRKIHIYAARIFKFHSFPAFHTINIVEFGHFNTIDLHSTLHTQSMWSSCDNIPKCRRFDNQNSNFELKFTLQNTRIVWFYWFFPVAMLSKKVTTCLTIILR